MTINLDQISQVTTNGKVYTEGGEKVGDVGQIYASDTSQEPTWVTVKTGLFGTAESFVPLEGARVEGDQFRRSSSRLEIGHHAPAQAEGDGGDRNATEVGPLGRPCPQWRPQDLGDRGRPAVAAEPERVRDDADRAHRHGGRRQDGRRG